MVVEQAQTLLSSVVEGEIREKLVLGQLYHQDVKMY